MALAEPLTKAKSEKMKPDETKAVVQELLEKMTPEVRSALEAMRRVMRSKKALTQPSKLPESKYFRLE